MADNELASGQRDRSPAYPVVALEVALTRLGEFDAHFKRSAARPEKIGEAWGIKAKAYADRIAAALRYFGLLEYKGGEGAGSNGTLRYVTVSEDGRKYLRAQREETRREVVKAAALRPKQIAKFWSEWGPDRPADAAAIDQLALESGFSDAGARDFLKVYDATIAFAKLSDSDKRGSIAQATDDEEGQEPMQTQDVEGLTRSAPLVQTLAPKPLHTGENWSDASHGKGARREVITLDEGDVVITFPENLSADSFGDLQAYLELFIKKMQRRAKSAQLLEKLSNVGPDADRWHEALTKPKGD